MQSTRTRQAVVRGGVRFSTQAGIPHRARSIAVLAALALLGGSIAGGCRQARQNATPRTTAYPITVSDDNGRRVTVKAEPRRIVSLAPDNTEVLFALGLGGRVVGVTTYCNYPPQAKAKPKIGDMMNPNVEKIIALRPDLVLATGAIQKPVIGQLEKVGIPVFVTFPDSYAEVLADIEKVGRLANRGSAAARVIGNMSRRRDDIAAKAKAAAMAAEGVRPKVFYEVYKEPLMTAGPGTFIDDVIRLAGGENVAAKAQKQYPEYSLETLVAQDPDVYLASSGTMGDPGELKQRPGWSRLRAVRTGHVYVIDQDIISRGGPRLADALEAVARALYPDRFK